MTRMQWWRASRFAAMATLAALLGMATESQAFSSGPPDGFANNPPNSLNCTLCHLDYQVNSGPGSLQLLNLPPTFQPGNTYDLLVRLQNPGQRRWGFELTVLGPANEQAGQIVVTDAVATQLSDNPGTMADYIKHTTEGTYAGTLDGPVTWSFQWVAPNLPNVQFYLAGNAADESKDPGGDYIYTLQASLDQGTVSALPTTWGAVKALYVKHSND
jgi:hypothetical protein